MTPETVTATSQPMLFISRTSSMDQADISRIMTEAFQTVGAFIGRSGIAPAGPPLCIYRRWDAGQIDFDVGFPVAERDLAKASSEFKAGTTPAGKTMKFTHRGPYGTLRETYAAITSHLNEKGLAWPALTWEVYVSDPEKTPEKDLVTDIYMTAE
jgi:effector-binding domain-containing protein